MAEALEQDEFPALLGLSIRFDTFLSMHCANCSFLDPTQWLSRPFGRPLMNLSSDLRKLLLSFGQHVFTLQRRFFWNEREWL